MATITLGPIIGKVTDTTARILLEVDQDVEVTCVAADSSGQTVSQARSFAANLPAVFTLSGLKPETEYNVTFNGVTTGRTGRVRTYSPDPHAMNVGAVSCNFTVNRGETNLWADLRDRYVRPGEINLLLHLGDQVYGDNAFAEADLILKGRTKVNPTKQKKILELYRMLYRYTWNDPATQEVMSMVPNLCIWDDHEIRDDWGSLDPDSNPESSQHYLGTLARRVYREYQRQLWDDFDTSAAPASGLEHHFHLWGKIGVMFLDQRGGRSFQRDSARPYLSTGQWQEIENALQPGGFFSGARALIVITSVPLAYLSTRISTPGSVFMNDLKDHWAFEPHRKEQVEFIRALRNWKEASSGNRDLIVLGGDVHVGGHTEIKHMGNTIFRQLITSPMTNHPPRWFEFHGIRALSEIKDDLTLSYSFEHSGFTNRRNFGIVIVRVPPTGLPRVEGSLVEAT